jgi:hypothetical protein
MLSDTQVIYSMVRVGRIVPPDKQTLRHVSLSLFCGANIGQAGVCPAHWLLILALDT